MFEKNDPAAGRAARAEELRLKREQAQDGPALADSQACIGVTPNTATRATWGEPPAAQRPRSIALVSWHPLVKGTLRGFATVELPIGLRLVDCLVLIGRNGAFATPPGKPQVDKEGRQKTDVTGRSLTLALRDGDRGGLIAVCHAGCSRADILAELRRRVLAPLHSSLHDVASGAHPPFVFAQGPPARPSDRPTGLTHDYVRACLAFALNLLLAPFGCISKKTALAWLAGEAARQRVVAEDGRAITVHQLDQWPRDIKAGSAPKTSREHFRELGELYRDTLRRIAGLPAP